MSGTPSGPPIAFEDRLGEAAARRVFAGQRRFAGLLGPRANGRLELVRLPIAVRVAANRDGDDEARLLIVERMLGHAWYRSLPVGRTTEPGPASVRSRSTGSPLPARLDLDACEAHLTALAARTVLVLRQRRHLDRRRFRSGASGRYPFWLRYWRGRGDRLRFDALDAITGRRAGGPLRAAIAAALIDADRALADS